MLSRATGVGLGLGLVSMDDYLVFITYLLGIVIKLCNIIVMIIILGLGREQSWSCYLILRIIAGVDCSAVLLLLCNVL